MITEALIARSKEVCASFFLDDLVTVYLLNGLSFTGTVGETDDNENVLALYVPQPRHTHPDGFTSLNTPRALIAIDIVNNPIVAHSVTPN